MPALNEMPVYGDTSLGERIIGDAHKLGTFTETDGMLSRTFMTPAHHKAAAFLAGIMCEAGMRVRRDSAGNVIGRYEGLAPNAKMLLTGSHFDTVKNAGMFDGPLGILLPIACVHRWNRFGKRFPFAIEVIGFSEEEGVRFKATLLGSRAISGTFDMSVLDNKDADGHTMREVMEASGFHTLGLEKAAYDPATVLGYLEVHIEQGPVLLNENLPLGVVTTISGATRFMVEVNGTGGHAGTVPMEMRHDAAMTAAEIGLFIERRCRNIPTLVGTVGHFEVPNGAANVVPGKAIFSIDIRAAEDQLRCDAVDDVAAKCALVEQERGVTVNAKKTHEAISVPCAQ
uniref:Peptidase M20 dimerisation domain-containing protein n=1 Tax=Plectus sambesii TaxID=2011161 RepID=A0A914X9U1_9BILA